MATPVIAILPCVVKSYTVPWEQPHPACMHSDSALVITPCLHRPALLDISPLLQDAAAAIVDDSFLRCFQSVSSDPWNWNLYLFPLWFLGLVLRYLILFPLRCAPCCQGGDMELLWVLLSAFILKQSASTIPAGKPGTSSHKRRQ